jgi:hypothetical protein
MFTLMKGFQFNLLSLLGKFYGRNDEMIVKLTNFSQSVFS